jgi:hypothetical protein
LNDEDHPHGKAAALLAYALDIESDGSVDPAQLNQLVDDVCEDETERARLVSFLAASQNDHLPKVVLELLGSRLDRLRDELETAEDMDTVYGVWGQRLASGSILASVGFVATSVVTGGWAALAVGAALVSGGATSYGRGRLKKRARASRRAVEQTERLIESIKGNIPKGG